MDQRTVLLVEDEYIIALDIRSTLEHIGYKVAAVASTGEEAVELSRDLRPGIVLMDIILGGEMDGVEAARLIRKGMDVPVVYLTAHTDEATFNRARATEPYGYILKPVSSDTLYTTIETALQRHRLEIRLKHSEDLLNRTGEMARVGGWEIDLANDRVYWTGVTRRIHEVPDDYTPTVAEAVNFFAPRHRPVITEAVARARSEGVPYDLEIEFITAGGKNLWVRTMGEPEFRDGRCVRLSGTFQDITGRKHGDDRLKQANEDLLRANEEMEAANEELAASQQELLQAHEELKEKEERFALFMEHLPAAVFIKDGNGIPVYANRRFAEAAGQSADDIARADPSAYTDPVMHGLFEEENTKVLRESASLTEEHLYPTPEGDRYWLTTKFPLLRGGVPAYVGAISVDITDRKAMERRISESEERFRLMVENIREALWIRDVRSERLLYLSPAYGHIWGRTVESAFTEPLSFMEAVHPDDRERVYEIYGRSLREDSVEAEYRVVRPGGETRWVWVRIVLLRDENGTAHTQVGVAGDITRRRLYEEQLDLSRRRMRALFDHSLDAIMLADDDARYVDVNPAACALTGFNRAELLNMTVMGLTPSVLLETGKKMWDEFIAAGEMKGEYLLTRKDGSSIDVEFSAASNITPGLHLSILRDISGRKKSEKDLRESEERHRTLLESINDSVYVLDRRWRHLLVNEAATRFTGVPREKLLGGKLTELFPGVEETPFFKCFERVMESRRKDTVESEFLFPDGTVGWFRVDVYPVPEGILCISRDITEWKRTGAALRESEERLRNVIEHMPVLVDAFDADGVPLFWNRECERVTGYAAEEIVGNPRAFELLYPNESYRNELMGWVEENQGDFRDSEWTLTARDGSKKTVRWSNISAHRPAPGWHTWAVGVDVTGLEKIMRGPGGQRNDGNADHEN